MSRAALDHPVTVVVGSGGVGKTTLAASLGVAAAAAGSDTLVMTFDPSRRLKDALGVGAAAGDAAVTVRAGLPGRLDAALLDAGGQFDRLVRRYAPDAAAARRILENRFYRQLAGSLAGILEYMAVERLFEVTAERTYDRVILDTPPTRQALDFLQAPERIVSFLDSGALRLALTPWFDERGRLVRGRARLVTRGLEAVLDRVIGLALLRDLAEFFQAFGPLYDGFRARATEVQALLRSADTSFVLVAGPGEERVADTLFFARKLQEAGCRLGAVVVNQVHPAFPAPTADPGGGLSLLHALGARDRRGLERLRSLLPGERLAAVPLLAEPPTGLAALGALGAKVAAGLA